MKRLVLSSMMGALAISLGLVSAVSAGTTNLLTNPGFEAAGGSYTGWFTFGSGPNLSTPGTDNIARTDSTAAKIFGEFNGCPSNPGFGVGGFGQAFTPTVGDVYTLRGYGFISSADPITGTSICNGNRLIAQIAFFNQASGGAVIARNEVVVGAYNTAQDQWVPFEVSLPAPSGALRVEALFLFLQPGCNPGAVFVDDVTFCKATPTAGSNLLVNPSFNTDLSGWFTFGNVFHDGRAFARRTPTGAAKLFSTFTLGSDSGMLQSFAAAPSTVWRFEGYAMTTCEEDPIQGSNDNFMVAKIVFRDGGGTEVGFSNQKVILDSDSSPGTWTKFSLSAFAPSGTASVEPLLLFVSPTIMGGAAFVDDLSFEQLSSTGVPDQANIGAVLSQSMPNPFRSSTQIRFELEERGPVTLKVYDVSGRMVADLAGGDLAAGSHVVRWDGKTVQGTQAPSGIYRYVLQTSKGRVSRSMVLTN